MKIRKKRKKTSDWRGFIFSKSEDKTRKMPENKGFFAEWVQMLQKFLVKVVPATKKRPCFRKVAKNYYICLDSSKTERIKKFAPKRINRICCDTEITPILFKVFYHPYFTAFFRIFYIAIIIEYPAQKESINFIGTILVRCENECISSRIFR